MSRVAAGHYVIYNRVLSPTGQKLAITSNGQGKDATVTPLTSAGNQIWDIQDFDGNTQNVVVLSSPSLQAGWGPNGVNVIPQAGAVWAIRLTDQGYTITDGGVTANWGVAAANANAVVTITKDGGGPQQRWVLEKQ